MIAALSALISMMTLAVLMPVPLETPPFEYTFSAGSVSDPYLLLLECEDNSITDYDQWFDSLGEPWPSATFHNGGVNDAIRGDTPPRGIAGSIEVPGGTTFSLFQVINSGDHVISFYGDPPNRFGVVINPRILVVHRSRTLEILKVLDFLTYTHDPEEGETGEHLFTFQDLKWAEIEDGVLYVSNGHRTYADSWDRTSFITALDLSTLELIWRSEPLVSNSHNFLLTGELIVTGYGFTAEDDFVYLLDRSTGEILHSEAVPSAPEYFHLDGDTLRVRCYDVDCEFLLVR